MRPSSYIPLFACLATTALASIEAPSAVYPTHRMIRKRAPKPLLPELHLTSNDPANNNKDFLSPVTDSFNSPDTVSSSLDKGHLTGTNTLLDSLQVTGGDSSLLDGDKVHVIPGQDGGFDLGTLGLNGVSKTTADLVSGTKLTSLTGGGLLGNGINLKQRGLLDDVEGAVNERLTTVTGAEALLDTTGALGGRLRGMVVKRVPLNLLPSTGNLPLGIELGTTSSSPDGSRDPYSAFGALPLPAANPALLKTGSILGGLKARKQQV